MSTAATTAGRSAPIEAGSRIRALDALRGVALLGIALANVRQMFMPWDISDFPVALAVGEWAAWLDWSLFHALVDLKFLTLFSLLFGISFALQSERLTATGRGFTSLYLRRVVILALFGLAHGALLYPAEVLMPYAVAGLLLLATHGWASGTLYRVGLWLVGTMAVWAYQVGTLGKVYLFTTLLTAGALGLALFLARRRDWRLSLGIAAAIVLVGATAMTLQSYAGPFEPEAAAEYDEARAQLAAIVSGDAAGWPAEYAVRAKGGFAGLVELHLGQYSLILLYFAILLLWRTLGLFMIGAAIFRSGALSGHSSVSWARVAGIGLGIGLPLSAAATVLHIQEIRGVLDLRFPEFLHELAAYPLAAGIAGIVFILSGRGTARWLWDRIEATGRMALTNYIGQSFVMAAIAESWGRGLYASFGGPAMTMLAFGVFAFLAVLSHLWLAYFRMGPLEWLWRCGTYWRWLPLRA